MRVETEMTSLGRESLFDWLPRPTSRIDCNLWPWVPPPRIAQFLHLLHAVDRSQWFDPEEIRARQLRQLTEALRFSMRNIPWYEARLNSAGIHLRQTLTESSLSRIPLLTRDELRTLPFQAEHVPFSHGGTWTKQTSGSTGFPVTIRNTQHFNLFFRALTVRNHHWHGHDLNWRVAAIRHVRNTDVPAEGIQRANTWGLGNGWGTFGPIFLLDISQPVSAQASWLEKVQPELLLSYPSNLAALAHHCREQGIRLRHLKQISTIGEMLAPLVRRLLEGTWDVPVIDMYSSEELGLIACQCPELDGYHIQSESVLVEVIDADGNPCPPGVPGRLVISALHNLATPLIRYELRDWATLGEPCNCGRGLPVLKNILGRERNMLTLPNGDKRWPLTGYQRFVKELPISQFQFVQQSLEVIEVRLVADRTISTAEEQWLTGVIQSALGHPFHISFRWMETIPRQPNGKIEEFISEL